MKTAVITGARSGLGSCLASELFARGWSIYDWSPPCVDVASASSVREAASKLNDIKIRVLINCAGVNRIQFLPDLDEADWDWTMDVNAKGIYLCTKALLENLKGGTVVNIVSNASHVPMTSSLAYNASKGAAAIMTRQMARELKKTHNITVFGISPNKLKNTNMSEHIDRRVQELRGWTAEQAREYQLAALPAGEETDPEDVAEFIGFLLSKKRRHKYLNGCDIPYGA